MSDDGCSNTAGVSFLAEPSEDPNEFTEAGIVDDLRCCAASVGTHAHVERTLRVVTEAARRNIELVGRDAEVEKNSLDRARESAVAEDGVEIAVVARDDVEPGILRRLADSIRVAVDPDNTKVWKATKECTAMTSPTKGSVDDPPQSRRLEEVDRFAHHHGLVIRLVRRGLIHGQSPGALAPTWKRAE